MGSEQVAQVLRNAGTHVRLVIARPVEVPEAHSSTHNGPTVPTKLLSDPDAVERQLTAYYQQVGINWIRCTR